MDTSQEFREWIEDHALDLRAILDINPLTPLDPFRLAEEMWIPVVMMDQVVGVTEIICDRLLGSGVSSWSGGALPLPDGQHVIILNPSHARTRMRATLMEEISHVHLDHKPSAIQQDHRSGLMKRSYRKTDEKQAYAVGAATLLPLPMLIFAAQLNLSPKRLANYCGVSVDLVKFRAKVNRIQLKG